MKYLISACLIGEDVKYDGKNNLHLVAKELYDRGLAVPVCPEVLGGLSTPRISSEIVNERVINKEGIDVTKEFDLGAKLALETAKKYDLKIAILQARSPSCGSSTVYDGTFSGNLIQGEGVTTKLLREHGIKVITITEYMRDYYENDF